MTTRIIPVETERKINELVAAALPGIMEKWKDQDTAEYKALSTQAMREIEIKLSDTVSQGLSTGEAQESPWLCHIQEHSELLAEWKKPKHYHINRPRQRQLAALRTVQAEGH